MKKLVAVLLASIILMASFVLTAAAQSVDNAETGANMDLSETGTIKTQEDAIAWAKSKVGKSIDTDGYPANQPYQCVDFIKAYYDFLGVTSPGGNGKDYATNKLPNGWNRYKGVQPVKGDILVYVGSTYGHVGIYESDYISYHQNFNGQHKVVKCTNKYNALNPPYWGVIRPNFSKIQCQNLGSKFYANIIANANTKFAVTANSKDNVYLGTLNYANAQKWLFERQSDKSYKITNVGMKKCLDLDDFGTANGTNIKVWTSNNSTAQRWFIIKNGSGYSIIPKCNQNSAMDINGAKYVNGRNINEWTRNTSTAQRFNITKTVDYKDLGKSFNAKIKSYNASFSVAANSKANVYLEKTANNTYQKWKFERQADMSYKITNVKTGKCLDVSGGKTANGTNIQVWKSNNSNAQRWFVVTNGKYYYLIPKCNLNGALDINGAKFVKGRNINEWTRNTSNAQKFSIVKV